MAKGEKRKKKETPDIDPAQEPRPIPNNPWEEEDRDKKDQEDQERIPVPPGEESPLPIQAPGKPDDQRPIYI